ncbi:MAG: hypothetical protein JJU06_14120 [Ectothiorhodospiraceae bacterium]|nr:hypothetical protein [Ectothiorhodospiraceae bacterium]MCH8504611.1 hypothetical protein [Ectothiorhodospiraceae bacterium]
MRIKSLSAAVLAAGLVAGAAMASDRIDHFEGLSAETLEEAVANFSEYNNRLAGILEKESLSDDDLLRIHELTYTLENALEKINVELSELAETLEELHIASETGDDTGAQRHGAAYLETARKVIP